MALIPMRDMLKSALAGGYAVGYFEAWDQYSLEAVLSAAEEECSPVILGFGGHLMNQAWYDGGGQRRLAALGRAAAEDARIPVSLIFNEVATFEQAVRGLTWGFNVLMLDTSDLPYAQNVAATRRIADVAHAVGADVEGELGRLPNASIGGAEAEGGALTDPEQAAAFVSETRVDALSVSIGNVHILMQGEATVDCAHLARVHTAVDVPLVVHGGTGLPDGMIPQIIELGVAKINVGSIMKHLFLQSLRESVPLLPQRVDIQDFIGSRSSGDIIERAMQCVKAEVVRRMRVYSSAGKA